MKQDNHNTSTAFDSIFSSVGLSETPPKEAEQKAHATKAKTAKPLMGKEIAASSKKASDQQQEQEDQGQSSKNASSTKRVLKSGIKVRSKTLFLKDEIVRMFKYVKFKKGLNESDYANEVFEAYFEHEFGEDWKELVR
jgi:hypothetical protein